MPQKKRGSQALLQLRHTLLGTKNIGKKNKK